MKESEAKTKRCCGAFPCGAYDDPDGTYGDMAIDSDGYGWIDVRPRYCIGSECMAWQKTDHNGDGHCGLVK